MYVNLGKKEKWSDLKKKRIDHGNIRKIVERNYGMIY